MLETDAKSSHDILDVEPNSAEAAIQVADGALETAETILERFKQTDPSDKDALRKIKASLSQCIDILVRARNDLMQRLSIVNKTHMNKVTSYNAFLDSSNPNSLRKRLSEIEEKLK